MLNTTPVFLKRLRFYGFGFLIGCMLVYFLLLKGQDRTGWLPGRRVIAKIDSTLSISADAKCRMGCNAISEADLKTIIRESEVSFSESSPQKVPCPVYILHGKLKTGEEVKLRFESNDTLATLTELNIVAPEQLRKTCPCM